MTVRIASQLAIALVLCCVLAAQPGTVAAQPQVHPRLFAIAESNFPSGSHITRSNIETNDRLLADEVGHFGLPPAKIGRITGYYMLAEEGAAAAGLPPYTSYLVSIFGTVHEAQRAFDYRWDLWFMRNFYTTPAAVRIKLGQGHAEALFRTLNPRLPQTTELFFRQGCVLVEVTQGKLPVPPSAEQTRSLYAIAVTLDAVARAHPQGA